jgi:hypothetical protein
LNIKQAFRKSNIRRVELWLNFAQQKSQLKPRRSGIHSGHRVRLQNRKSRVRIPLGCKVFRN